MITDPELTLLQAMPSAVIIGVEAARRAGWTTQIPVRYEVAIELDAHLQPNDMFVFQPRSAAWFKAVHEHLNGDRAFGLPWLSPAWALADMLRQDGWGNCGLWPDDIEWEEVTPSDEAAWRAAANFFQLPNVDLLSMKVFPRA